MEILEQKIKLKNSCELIGKSKDIFSPVKEAITNSLDAISQRQKTNETFTPAISVSIYFKSQKKLFDKEEEYLLDCISVEDNGVGFTSANLARFKELADNTKGLNNRGTGKIQIFSHFDKISIGSIFSEESKWSKLNASWKITGEYESDLAAESKQTDRKTVVTMSGFSGDNKEQNFFVRYLTNIDELKRDVMKRFLLRLWLGAKTKQLTLTIRTFLEENKQGEFIFHHSNIPTPDKEEKITVDTEQPRMIYDKKDRKTVKVEWIAIEPQNELIIRRFKLANTDMDENGVYMCSKDIVVESFKFPAVRKNANFNGYRYLTSISGNLLDNSANVNQSVDGFSFPSKKKIEAELKDGSVSLFNQDNKFIFWDEIKNKVGRGLSNAYSDVEGLKEEREQDIVALAKQYGISIEDAEGSNIAFNDTEEEATEKLFETQAKRFAKQSIEIQKTYKELKDLGARNLDPTSDEYRNRFDELTNKLLEKIPQQNKDELTRYIIRRDMVVELLKLALNNDLAKQKEWAKNKVKGRKIGRSDKEGVIHDLIFKRRMKGVPNDLWILNEEFVHFGGCSDLELNKLEINGEKLLRDDVDIDAALSAVGLEKGSSLEWRPDIFLYPEEGKCVLVEFKAPQVDLTKYCDQIQKYAKIIANYSNRRFTQFYGYLIGEEIQALAIPDRYKKVPYGNYWVYSSEPINDIKTGLPIADIYQEIMPLSEIAKRAEIRNKSFAEKIGITSDDITKAQKTEGDMGRR